MKMLPDLYIGYKEKSKRVLDKTLRTSQLQIYHRT